MKTFYQLAEAIKTEPRGLSELWKNASLELILKGLPHREIVLFALHCAEDCQQFDNENSSQEVIDCNAAAQDCINHINLWLNDNKVDCSQAAESVYDANSNIEAINKANYAAAYAAYAAYAAARATTNVAQASVNAAHAANYAYAAINSNARFLQYVELAKDMRENVRTYDLPNEVIQLAKELVKIDDLNNKQLGLIADYLMDYDSDLIKEINKKFVFTLLPSITGNSHQEVYDKIAKSTLAKQLIVQSINNS